VSGLDLFEEGFPHSTREGYDRGCRGHACPGLLENGFSCADANVRHHGDYAYLKRVEAGLSPAEIAAADRADRAAVRTRKPTKVTVEPVPPVPVEPKPVPQQKVEPVPAKPWRTTATKPGPKSKPVPHGTQAGYQRGCRENCPGDPETGKTCRTAATEYQREYKARRAANGGQPLARGTTPSPEDKVVQGFTPEDVAALARLAKVQGTSTAPDAVPVRRENWVVRFARWLGVMPL
jgi:hypothetical protein